MDMPIKLNTDVEVKKDRDESIVQILTQVES